MTTKLERGIWVLFLGLGMGLLGFGAPQEPAEAVGRDTCLACHDMVGAFAHTPHAATECEECHGAGSLHLESFDDSLSFEGKTPRQSNARCLSCHAQDTTLSAFAGKAHGQNEISCLGCHQVHPEEINFGLLAKSENQLCQDCHQRVAAQFSKPFHHPVGEGSMKCVDCHDPHLPEVSSLPSFASGSQDKCLNCHSEKKGPFVFEHLPMKVNNCQSCHEPHGSINPRMLSRTRVDQLCLECHTLTPGVASSRPPSFHNLQTARFQQCTVCHNQIHGSNSNRLFLQ